MTFDEIAHYRVIKKLGAGGMGEVYLAEDTRLDRRVALKLLAEQFTGNEDHLRRFVQEAKAASALNHPNIITVHEIGQVQTEAGGRHYIATEFIEGETLRNKLSRGRLTIDETLDVAIQAAGAIAAAHKAGIIHRDIKPENIMLREDGIVKTLDFGLAKLTVRRPVVEKDAATIPLMNTGPGVVMGTAQYMSPEQARGKEVDARSDIFSLGVTLYEMLAGRAPFEGETHSDVIAALLEREPAPIARLAPDAPPDLHHIINKALRKNREERYGSVKSLLADLKALKQELEFAARLERSSSPEPYTETQAKLKEESVAGTRSETISSAKIIAGEIKRHKLGVALTLLAFVIAAGAAYFYFNREPALTDKDTILLTDFVNTTGDAVFDGALKQGLAAQLGQSPFLNILPDTRTRQTLLLMGRSPDERVTREIGREIGQRQGLKAFITGSIARLDRNYLLTLEAVNSQSGETIALTQVEAEGKDHALKALSQAATSIREKLGESLNSIQKFDAPLEVTTSSLEALKSHSLGMEQLARGRTLEAIPFQKRAVELDPNFASAHVALAVLYSNLQQPAAAAEYIRKAFALKDRGSELERLRISHLYYALATRELDKEIESLKLYKRTYPRDERALANLGVSYLLVGQFENVVEVSRECLRLNPNLYMPYTNLGEALIRLNRFAEAGEIYGRALQQKLGGADVRAGLYHTAFVNGDVAAMKRQLDWAAGKPEEYMAYDWQANTAGFAGQYRRAQDFRRRAIDLATRGDVKEVAAQYAAEAALFGAVFIQCRQTNASAAQALALERNDVSLTRAALALALCGASAQAQSLANEAVRRYPKDTVLNGLWLPLIRAAMELHAENAGTAIELLQPAIRYEPAGAFWPQYVRGQAYLKLDRRQEAGAEFRKILDHRGEAPLSALYPLAALGLARAAALTGDAAGSRKSYQDFFALWKEADADLSALTQAKKEYESLK